MSTHVECCGKPRMSRFCPECGKALVDGPLLELLAHCRTVEKGHRKAARDHREAIVKYEARGDQKVANNCQGLALERDARADVWKARGDALAAIIEPPAD